MESKSDGELVRLARAGDKSAFDALIQRHQRVIWGVARLLLDDPAEAQDVTQEAFLRAWLNLDLLSDLGKFAPWLRRIVFGVSIDWLRVFRPDLYRLSDANAGLALSRHADGSESALARLEALELRQRIWDAVARLPPRYRLPLTLFHLDGLSHAKVAEALGVPVSTVRSLVTRGRQKLQPMLASEAGQLLPAVDDLFQGQEAKAMFHITDGESVAGTLRESGIPGEVAIYGDLMYEGPAPGGVDGEAWREVRARFIGESGYATIDEARKYLKSCEDALAASLRHDEVVIWMDYRLSDQLILIRALDWFSRQDLAQAKLSLICAGSFQGMDRFVGFGQLTANQLASLADTRQRVGEAEFRMARAGWDAFTAPDPMAIEQFLQTDTSALPFLAPALRRHLEQFPSVENGLSRTERLALAILGERGTVAGKRLFFEVQQQEEQVFMGNWSFYRMMAELAEAKHPLVRVTDTVKAGLGDVAITKTGRNVLEGRADAIELNGMDRWLGGVHLQGDQAVWRWSGAAGRIVGR